MTPTKFVVAGPAAWNQLPCSSATLHPWTVPRRLWKDFCLYLISDCTVTVLRHLRMSHMCHDITIIIIIIIIKLQNW